MKEIIKNLLIIVAILIIAFGIYHIVKKNKQKLDLEIDYQGLKEKSIMYDENAELEDLKQEYNMSGDSNLYEIQTEYDGRKVLVIKPNENYKVAFAGLIKRDKPDMNEVSEIYETNHPTENGIWIEQESRDKILNYLNNNLSSKYEIDENGYLKILDKQESEKDNEIASLINGDKQYLLSINGISYYIDALTGNIIDDIYEEMDKYQTYSYFKDENRMIIFITENKEKVLTNEEIVESILKLVKK